jgi:hypothetical protein
LLYTYSAIETLFIYQTIPERVQLILWEGGDFDDCLLRNETNYRKMDKSWASGGWQTERKGCIRREGFEDGIPIWKNFVFHFWGDNRWPLGPGWTLSPTHHAAWSDTPEKENQYLGEHASLCGW